MRVIRRILTHAQRPSGGDIVNSSESSGNRLIHTGNGSVIGWLWAIIGIIKKSIILNNIVWQLILISTVCFFWDRFTGKLGWSVDFVFPILCVCAMIAVIILSQVLHIKAGDYIINLILCSLTGVIPMILIFTGIVRIIIPSVICSSVALIIIFVQIIFNYKVMYSEICKKLHM